MKTKGCFLSTIDLILSKNNTSIMKPQDFTSNFTFQNNKLIIKNQSTPIYILISVLDILALFNILTKTIKSCFTAADYIDFKLYSQVSEINSLSSPKHDRNNSSLSNFEVFPQLSESERNNTSQVFIILYDRA